ncbi:MAG TPA: hypothetical protein VL742_09235 [Casimicrobiaceae bacterium]|nr:hypothetical protein [Casimicrobiaceae bacterium]
MKALFVLVSVLLLGSCAGAPVMSGSIQSSFNGTTYSPGPTGPDDPRLRASQFYMNDDKSVPEPQAAPSPLRFGSADAVCAASCQARHYSAAYCNDACSH